MSRKSSAAGKCLKFLPLVILQCIILQSCAQENSTSSRPEGKEPKVFVYYKTAGFKHESIPAGLAALEKICSNNGLTFFSSPDSSHFNTGTLTKYATVIFLNTTGNVLNNTQQEALMAYIRAGGGFLGIHSAADTEADWPWYVAMLGASFDSHPAIQDARIIVSDKNFIASRMLPAEWRRKDEWYNFREISDKIRVLASLDESSYEGGKNGPGHPIAWYQEFEGGRVFYTGGGHTVESYSEPLFLQHLEGGLKYCLGMR